MVGKYLYIDDSSKPFIEIHTCVYQGNLPYNMKHIVMGNDKGKAVFVTYDGNKNSVNIWGDVPKNTNTLYVGGK